MSDIFVNILNVMCLLLKNFISYGIFVAMFCISGSYPAREAKFYAGSKKE
jgi:hypothetical protein